MRYRFCQWRKKFNQKPAILSKSLMNLIQGFNSYPFQKCTRDFHGNNGAILDMRFYNVAVLRAWFLSFFP